MNPPKWYDADTLYNLPNFRHVPFHMTKTAAEWLANEFQLAFNKGWEKAIAQVDSQRAASTEPSA